VPLPFQRTDKWSHRNHERSTAFSVEAKVSVPLDLNLALELGDFITDNKPENTALWALGCQLRDIILPDQRPIRWVPQARSIGRTAFTVDTKIKVDLDVNLALELGDFITDNKPENTALWALGCRLRDIIPPDEVAK
jgi:hypothetical protein